MIVLTFLVAILLVFYQASSSPADQALGRQMRSASNGYGKIIPSSQLSTDIEADWQSYDNYNDDIGCVDCFVSQRMASPDIGKRSCASQYHPRVPRDEPQHTKPAFSLPIRADCKLGESPFLFADTVCVAPPFCFACAGARDTRRRQSVTARQGTWRQGTWVTSHVDDKRPSAILRFIKKFSKIGDCMQNMSDCISDKNDGGGADDANSTLAP